MNDISTESVKVLWYFCLHPAFKTKWATVYTLINVSFCSLFAVLAIKGILLTYDSDAFFMSECLETCILMAHIISNVLALHTHRENLLKLLEHKSTFWEITKSDDDSLRVEILKNNNFVKKIIRTYFIFTVFSATLFDLQPFTTGLLPSVCYIPNGWFNFLTAVLWYLSYVAVLSLIGIACLFCSLVSSLTEQFQLLAYRFREMCNKRFDIRNELETLVSHHNFLMSYCEDINTTFGSIFLLDFVLCIASASVSVFIFLQPGDWAYRMKCITHFLVIIVEMGFYCVPLEIATNTAVKLTDIIYDSKWYEIESVPIKKSLILTISRAQRPIVFSGYGLININLNTYVLICKTVFSFYTYLNSVKKLTNK
ncbi:hypothetical protein Zmor_000659 [Zophobas morio]|uniref:Odorant receptor n=1 Tax=Zophobas morio TaxID=2755281 RepID=A0AA38IWV8_9CUCU|nr:hypothetical protein Zmor_000659 [Zophobas morio]